MNQTGLQACSSTGRCVAPLCKPTDAQDEGYKVDFMNLAKWLLVLAGVLVGASGFFYLLGRFGLNGLPGDLEFRSQNVTVYFPIVTCIVLSLVLTLVMRWFSK